MGQRSDTKAVSIGTTPKEILPLRAEREVVWIYNPASSAIYYCLGPNVTDSFFTGRLTANEGSLPIYKYSGPITAVRSSGTSTVLVTECW